MVGFGTVSAASKVLMGSRSVVALSGVWAVATVLTCASAGHLRYVQLQNTYLHSELILYCGVDAGLDLRWFCGWLWHCFSCE